MVGAHADPASVRAQVVDPVRNGLAQPLIGEIVRLHLDRLTRRTPLPSGVLVLTDQFFPRPDSPAPEPIYGRIQRRSVLGGSSTTTKP
jgi:hypothetical protein